MDQLTQSLLCISIMLLMLNTGLPIALSLGMSALIVGSIATGTVTFIKLGWTTFQTVFNPSWTALPLFIFMGSVISETKIGEDLFKSARLWLSRIPGGLIAAAVLAQAGLSAILGNAAATILTIGAVALPELERYGYDRKLSIGAITSGGALGPLIPPSTMAIIMSSMVGEALPLGRFLIATIIPGILLAIMLSMVPIIKCIHNPSLGASAGPVPWRERFRSLKKIWPTVAIFIALISVIFFGIATATEAGAVGVLLTMIIAVFLYGTRWKQILKASIEAITVNARVLFIVIGANFFAYIVGSSTLAKQLADVCAGLGSPIIVVIAIQLILLILGCVIDGSAIMMVTIPLFFPLIIELGIDPLWFAILFMSNMEIGLITPPMGLNFFLVRQVYDISSHDLFKGLFPYILALIAFLVILIVFPSISIWLPNLMMSQ